MPWFYAITPYDADALALLDQALHYFHFSMVVFLSFGWLIRPLRLIHLITLGIVWFSWLVLGLYVGHLGYCVVTDWHWQVKTLVGLRDLPPSYIEYLWWQAGGRDIDDLLVSWITGSVFVLINLMSIGLYLNARRAVAK